MGGPDSSPSLFGFGGEMASYMGLLSFIYNPNQDFLELLEIAARETDAARQRVVDMQKEISFIKYKLGRNRK